MRQSRSEEEGGSRDRRCRALRVRPKTSRRRAARALASVDARVEMGHCPLPPILKILTFDARDHDAYRNAVTLVTEQVVQAEAAEKASVASRGGEAGA
jgi:hypothetical protein